MCHPIRFKRIAVREHVDRFSKFTKPKMATGLIFYKAIQLDRRELKYFRLAVVMRI
jgi:hypothetical protein